MNVDLLCHGTLAQTCSPLLITAALRLRLADAGLRAVEVDLRTVQDGGSCLVRCALQACDERGDEHRVEWLADAWSDALHGACRRLLARLAQHPAQLADAR